jgi:hypothetical protein
VVQWNENKTDLRTENQKDCYMTRQTTNTPLPDVLRTENRPGPAKQRTKRVESGRNAIVSIYHSHVAAEEAVKRLQEAGFDMKKLSIIGRDFHTEQHIVGFFNTGDRMKYWGKLGAFWGGLWGLLFGAAFFWVPGIGPVLVAGPLASAIVAGLEGAVVGSGLSALGAGLYGLGIPKNSVLQYESALKAGKYVLVVHGTNGEAPKARAILKMTEPAALDEHQG